MKMYWIFPLLVLAFISSGCNSSPTGMDDSQKQQVGTIEESPTQVVMPTVTTESPKQIMPISTDQGDSIQMTQPLPTPYDPGVQVMIDKAVDDLAQRLGIPKAEIKVVEVIEVTWPDASLGCPKMGLMYAQVVTPGYQITLEANGKPYSYHTDSKETVILCGIQPGVEYSIEPTP